MARQLHGVLPVFQTPFRADGTVDLGALALETEWIVAQGVQGVVLGMVSETLRLTEAEREDVIRTSATVARAAGLACVASVGAESSHVALERVQRATAAGATALMVAPPLNGRHLEHELERYFLEVLGTTDLPVVVQDASGYVGQSLTVAMQARLFEQFGTQVMFKPEAVPLAPILDDLLARTHGRAEVLEGMGGAALLDTFHRGIVGTMPGAEVCWAVSAMWRALTAGNETHARRIHQPLAKMIALQTDLDSFVVCEKFLLAEQGVLDNTTARGPLSFELSREHEQLLRTLLDDLRTAVDGEPAMDAQIAGMVHPDPVPAQ